MPQYVFSKDGCLLDSGAVYSGGPFNLISIIRANRPEDGGSTDP
jgi:hypothetical protein